MIRTSTRSALVIVDVQNDFLPDEGSLAVPDGRMIIKPLKEAAKEVDLVICSRDWHPRNHCSFKGEGGQWPVHCVQRTPGARIVPSLRRLAKYTISKGMDPKMDAFSAFAGHTLRPERTLKEILEGEDIGVVIVGGLAFDVCVKWTAFDSNALAFRTIVPLELSAALTPIGSHDTVVEMGRVGIEVPAYFNG